MTVRLLIEQLLNGLVLGAMYASVAGGLTLIWGTMKMINFAHGEFYMIGAYIVFFALNTFGVHPIIAVILSVMIVFVVGTLIEKLCLHPLLDKPNWEINAIVATVGLSIFFQNFALKAFGERFKSIPYFVSGNSEFSGLRMANQRILIIVVTSAVMLGLWLFIKKSRYGLALRATAQNRDASTILGINTKMMYTTTFGISCSMAALAGILLAPIFQISPWMGSVPIVKGFVCVVLGGLGSFGGAILGGIILGTVESLSVIIFSSEWKDVVAFVILILVLWVKPSGLFGAKEW